jgi:hypothetical protein
MAMDSIENLIDGDSRNLARFQFLSLLEKHVPSVPSPDLQRAVLAFIRQKKSSLLDHLRKPELDELKLITNQTMAFGGLQRLQNTYVVSHSRR